MKLRSSNIGWRFQTEAELEDFVWAHLHELFGIAPLKRQHCVDGQFCDIIAVSGDHQLIVIELKNDEDRYVVQQLTRYYHALMQERPYSEQVDYAKPVRLIAIAPLFHRDNWIDQQYNCLAIEFFAFEIVPDGAGFVWQLRDLGSAQTWQFMLPDQAQNSAWTLPPVPRKLLNNLANVDENRRAQILQIRQTLLQFDQRMKEMTLASHISYGKGKMRLCAEFRFGSPLRSLSQPKLPNLLLWLPHPDRKQICRMLICTQDWLTIERLYYCPASSRRVHGGNAYWQDPAWLLNAFQEWGGETAEFGVKYYNKLLEQPDRANEVNLWVEIALERWFERL